MYNLQVNKGLAHILWQILVANQRIYCYKHVIPSLSPAFPLHTLCPTPAVQAELGRGEGGWTPFINFVLIFKGEFWSKSQFEPYPSI